MNIVQLPTAEGQATNVIPHVLNITKMRSGRDILIRLQFARLEDLKEPISVPWNPQVKDFPGGCVWGFYTEKMKRSPDKMHKSTKGEHKTLIDTFLLSHSSLSIRKINVCESLEKSWRR